MSRIQVKPKDSARIKEFVDKLLAFSKGPGIAVILSAGGRRVEVCSGVSNTNSKLPLTPSALFAAGCLRKLFTSFVVLQLVSDGVLAIDQPIAAYLAEFEGKNGRSITLRSLLSHSGGYQQEDFADADVMTNYNWELFSQSFRHRKRLFEPGTVYDYSHSASVVLGEIVKRVTGITVKHLLFDTLFRGLLDNSPHETRVAGHIVHPVSRNLVPVPPPRWSGFWNDSLGESPIRLSTVITVAERLLDNEGHALILKELTSNAVRLPRLFGGRYAEDVPIAHGLGLARFANDTFGVKFTSPSETFALRIYPTKKIAVAVAINACQPAVRDFIVNKLINGLLSEDLCAVADRSNSGTFEAKELTGQFQGAINCSIVGSLENKDLVFRLGSNPSINYQAVPPFIFSQNKDNDWIPQRDANFLSMGFFRDPANGTPCLMIGDSAYKKVAN
jgi:CubicO group peptidase (beta-lactamase class C family)